MVEKKDQNHDELIARREMLKLMLKYSTVAAAILAGPLTLFEAGCGGGGGVTPEAPDGLTPNTAYTINLGQSFTNLALSAASKNCFYCRFNPGGSTNVDLILNITHLASGELVCKLLDSNLNVITSSPVNGTGIISSTGLKIQSGNYILFQCLQDEVDLSFTLVDPNSPTWSNQYSDWNDTYSDWSDTYSDWSDTYSDWVDEYSDWSDAYSDWSNYSDWTDHWSDWWNMPWGNWMQSW